MACRATRFFFSKEQRYKYKIKKPFFSPKKCRRKAAGGRFCGVGIALQQLFYTFVPSNPLIMKKQLTSALCAIMMLAGLQYAGAQQAYESNEMLGKVLRPAVSIVVNGDKKVTQQALSGWLKQEGVPVSGGKIAKATATTFGGVSPQYVNVFATVETMDKKLLSQKVSIFLSTGAGDDAPFMTSANNVTEVGNLKQLLETKYVAYHNNFVKEANIASQAKEIAASQKKLKSLENELDRLNSSVEKTKALIEKQRKTIDQQEEALKALKK